MSISVTKQNEFLGFTPNTPYSIQILDEGLMGASVIITEQTNADEYNEYTLKVESLQSIFSTVPDDLLLTAYDSKELYKQYPFLIESGVIIIDLSLASYINNGAGKHDLDSQI